MLASIVLPRPTWSARMARPPICRSTRWATSIWWGSSLIALASRVINRSKPGTRAIRSASRRRSYQARSAGAPRSCSANTVSERSSTDQTSAAGAGGGGRGDGASGGSGMVGQRVAGGRNIQPDRCLYKPNTQASPGNQCVEYGGCRLGGQGSSFRAHGAVAQLGERLDRTQEVRGSSPLSSIQELPLGVIGNTPDSGSGESWFEPRRGNSKRDARLSRVALPHFSLRVIVSARVPPRRSHD